MAVLLTTCHTAALPDGRTSKQYLAKLAELETTAKGAKRGAWRFVK
jgi:hypothetical protein